MNAGGPPPDPRPVTAAGTRSVAAGVINAPVFTGDVVVAAGPRVRSAYLEQVRRIAPEALRDRDRELAELAAFCTGGGAGGYGWWRAPAWVGKSALLSWFVLHPPAGVRVVSFFVTARLAGQSDRVAFTDVVLEQLAELLDRPLPAYLTEATRDGHLRGMLTAAAEHCHARGERLVLVVDGLDEDRGVTARQDPYSIAGLLPASPPAGLRVVVAGRPDPPIPADVPPGHPLRDPAIVHPLDRSPHATHVQQDAERELKRLLHGPAAGRELLGLVTAAGGGLSGPDLAELTDRDAWEVEDDLHSVAGRTFRRRASRLERPGPEVYLLGHEELQNQAARYLAARLPAYRDRLHAWADRYRAERWPERTPEYLLRGYHRLLVALDDLPRAAACATDAARHDRMLDITGGDTAALAEITATQDLALARPDPDLLALARLARHARALAERNANIPTGLPAVWERLGRPLRAEALARSITDPFRLVAALAGMVRAAVDRGRAAALGEQAEAVARAMEHPEPALADVTAAVAQAGELDRAEAVAGGIADGYHRVRALAAVARAAAAVQDTERAGRLAETAFRASGGSGVAGDALEDLGRDAVATRLIELAPRLAANLLWGSRDGQGLLDTALSVQVAAQAAARNFDSAAAQARAIVEPDLRASTLADLARTAARAGAGELAGALIQEAEAVVRSIADPQGLAVAASALAEAAGAAGDPARAAALARLAERAGRTVGAHRGGLAAVAPAIASALASAGLLSRAEAVSRMVGDDIQQAEALVSIAAAAASRGETERAVRLAEVAEVVARSVADAEGEAATLEAVVRALAAAGEVGRAEALAGTLADAERQARAFAELVRGDPGRAAELAGRAEAAARSIDDEEERVAALTAVAQALAAAGHTGRATGLVRDVLATTGEHLRDWALPDLVRVLVAAGDVAGAEALARTIGAAHPGALALADLASAAAAAGDLTRAATLARDAEGAARRSEEPAWPLARAAVAVAEAGDLDRAEVVAGSIAEPYQQVWALADLAGMAAAAGDAARAGALARRAEDAARSAGVERAPGMLAQLAGALADAGAADRAERLAATTNAPAEQAKAFARLATRDAAAEPRRRVALALRLGWGPEQVAALGQIQPAALAALADELLARH